MRNAAATVEDVLADEAREVELVACAGGSSRLLRRSGALQQRGVRRDDLLERSADARRQVALEAHGRSRASGQRVRHRHVDGAAGGAHHAQAAPEVDERAVVVDAERADARVEALKSVREREEAAALQRDVERASRVLERALRRVDVDRRHHGAVADLHRVHAAEVAVRRGAGADRRAQDVAERRPRAAKAGGADVGEVVADDVDVVLVKAQARQPGEQRSADHVCSCCFLDQAGVGASAMACTSRNATSSPPLSLSRTSPSSAT